MAERMTSCNVRDRSTRSADESVCGIADYGRKTRAEMIAQFRAYHERQKAEAERALALSDDDLIVETYTGVYVRKNVTEVTE